ncbi:MAG: 1-deoxy-D-xylulose-5-phosphate reductoisomerase [Dehalococcoidales bacterium]|nr:1-deoxy-D-xylulose-5-phosphate reductoisomerase [Dehalococcoidales bacterium]
MTGVIKQLAILGSTGSIGQQTLEVVRAFPHRFRVIGLAAGKNIDLLARQVNEFRPRLVYFQDGKSGQRPADINCEFLPPEDIASHPEVDTVVIATSGRSGLLPLMAAVKAGKEIALANKESLVAAGEIITREAGLSKARILPLDSEHSAIWQCLQGESQKPIRLVLTASGGPFLHYSKARLGQVTVEQALKHPSWRMGRKVTVDSATLMNKGLEVIEAHWLFDMSFESIEVLVHPQSIVHSLVEFVDGSVKAQLGCPDMRLPIQYALSYPERLPNPYLERLNWDVMSNLTFGQVDPDVFPCLRLAIEAGRKGGTYPAVLCAADEVAVNLFLSRRIEFTGIARLVEQVLERHQMVACPNLDEIISADGWARETASRFVSGDSPC